MAKGSHLTYRISFLLSCFSSLGYFFHSPTQLPAARGARKRREGHRRRIVFLWPRGQRRYPHVELEWYYHRSRTRTYISLHFRIQSNSPQPTHARTHARTFAQSHCTSSSSLSVCLSLSTTWTIENAPMKQTKNNACRARLLQTVHENRIYSLSIICGENYPDRPPTIQFISRVNLPFVSQTDGKVDPAKLPVLCNWTRSSSIETVLVEIRRSVQPHPSLLPFTYPEQYFYFLRFSSVSEMASFNNRKLPQPPEGSTFF